MTKKKVLITYDEATPALRQHTGPCTDCPWARESVQGWLGSNTVDEWLAAAHGEEVIPCHVHDGAQCAGAAIYRANVCKLPRDAEQLRLARDRERVFATPREFKTHHDIFGK